MEKQSETLSGKWSTVMDLAHHRLANLGDELAPTAKGFMNLAIEVLKTSDSHKDENKQIDETIGHIRALQAQLTASNTSEQDRLKILQELKDINPTITQGINAEAIQYGKLADNINKVVTALAQKQIANNIEDASASLITKYNKAQESQASGTANIFTLLAQVDPSLAGSNMSIGQKELAAINMLRGKIKSGNVHGYNISMAGATGGAGSAITGSLEQDQLNALQKSINETNTASTYIKDNQKKIDILHQQIESGTNAYNKFFGLTSPNATTTNSTGTSFDNLTTGTTKGLQSGGQKTITINIKSFIERFELSSVNVREGAAQLENMMKELFLRVVNSANGLSPTN
jgi:hypothetical protein